MTIFFVRQYLHLTNFIYFLYLDKKVHIQEIEVYSEAGILCYSDLSEQTHTHIPELFLILLIHLSKKACTIPKSYIKYKQTSTICYIGPMNHLISALRKNEPYVMSLVHIHLL